MPGAMGLGGRVVVATEVATEQSQSSLAAAVASFAASCMLAAPRRRARQVASQGVGAPKTRCGAWFGFGTKEKWEASLTDRGVSKPEVAAIQNPTKQEAAASWFGYGSRQAWEASLPKRHVSLEEEDALKNPKAQDAREAARLKKPVQRQEGAS